MPINEQTGQLPPNSTASGEAIAIVIRDDRGNDDIRAIFANPAESLAYCKIACANQNWRLCPVSVIITLLSKVLEPKDLRQPPQKK